MSELEFPLRERDSVVPTAFALSAPVAAVMGSTFALVYAYSDKADRSVSGAIMVGGGAVGFAAATTFVILSFRIRCLLA